MKEEIIRYFKSDRSYDEALRLYMKYGNRISLKKQINVQPRSTYLHGLVNTELATLAGVSLKDLQVMLSQPLQKVIKAKPFKEPDASIPTIQTDAELDVSDGKTTSASSDPAGSEGISVYKDIPEGKKIPKKVIGAVKLRQEFPFLSDPACPNELKILVADMLSAYEEFKQKHEELFTAETEPQMLAAASETVEKYLDNQAIWKELNHYKETGQILGEYKFFAQDDRFQEIRSMTTPDLVKLKERLENNLVRNRKKIKDEPKHPKTGERREKIKQQEAELKEVKRILNIK